MIQIDIRIWDKTATLMKQIYGRLIIILKKTYFSWSYGSNRLLIKTRFNEFNFQVMTLYMIFWNPQVLENEKIIIINLDNCIQRI